MRYFSSPRASLHSEYLQMKPPPKRITKLGKKSSFYSTYCRVKRQRVVVEVQQQHSLAETRQRRQHRPPRKSGKHSRAHRVHAEAVGRLNQHRGQLETICLLPRSRILRLRHKKRPSQKLPGEVAIERESLARTAKRKRKARHLA